MVLLKKGMCKLNRRTDGMGVDESEEVTPSTSRGTASVHGATIRRRNGAWGRGSQAGCARACYPDFQAFVFSWVQLGE